MDIIVTDLTKFNNPECRCVAGLTPTGTCYRPTSNYFTLQECAQLNILPGAVLRGDFTILNNAEVPHTEDCSRENVSNAGNYSTANFKQLLVNDCSGSVEDGFDADLSDYRKCIPQDSPPDRSIITVKANSVRSCWFNISDFNGKLCFTFRDESNDSYSYMPIADLGIRKYFESYEGDDVEAHLNRFIHAQEEVYLRVGVGRCFTIGERTGFWLQMNGIYTFPNALPGTRSTTD